MVRSLAKKLCCFFVLMFCAAAVADVRPNASKQHEQMVQPVAIVRIGSSSASAVIVSKKEIDDGKKEYLATTNFHVSISRYKMTMVGADPITGWKQFARTERAINIFVTDWSTEITGSYLAQVVSEDYETDFALLKFESKMDLSVANIASIEMIQDLRLFDECFSVGNSLGEGISTSKGIIASLRFNEDNSLQEIGMTSQIIEGVSGGGLFKKVGDDYYLVGIPNRVMVASNGQRVFHMAKAIPVNVFLETIEGFICQE